MMTRFSKTLLMLGAAVIALSACSSSKGPGQIGTKADIVVNNKGMPGAQQATAAAAPADPSVPTSTMEQVEPNPAPEVAAAEPVPPPAEQTTPAPLPDNSPAMQQAVQQQEQASAPVSSQTTPVSEMDQAKPIDSIAPTEPVNAAATPPAAPAAESVYADSQVTAPGTVSSSVYQRPAPLPTPAPAPAPAAATAPATPSAPIDYDTAYPATTLQTAPVAAAVAAVPVAAGTTNPSDPTMVKAAQAALQAKGLYKGPQTGKMDSEFLNALSLYQGQNKLPQGGVNVETLRHLGVME